MVNINKMGQNRTTMMTTINYQQSNNNNSNNNNNNNININININNKV